MTKVIRPPNVSHYLFMRNELKERWGKLHYRRLGKIENSKELIEWCEASTMNEFYHSIGHEVFYFQNELDLATFILRWGV